MYLPSDIWFSTGIYFAAVATGFLLVSVSPLW
jgi:hypothetical protein